MVAVDQRGRCRHSGPSGPIPLPVSPHFPTAVAVEWPGAAAGVPQAVRNIRSPVISAAVAIDLLVAAAGAPGANPIPSPIPFFRAAVGDPEKPDASHSGSRRRRVDRPQGVASIEPSATAESFR